MKGKDLIAVFLMAFKKGSLDSYMIIYYYNCKVGGAGGAREREKVRRKTNDSLMVANLQNRNEAVNE